MSYHIVACYNSDSGLPVFVIYSRVRVVSGAPSQPLMQ